MDLDPAAIVVALLTVSLLAVPASSAEEHGDAEPNARTFSLLKLDEDGTHMPPMDEVLPRGECSLRNPFAIEGDTFAWLEAPSPTATEWTLKLDNDTRVTSNDTREVTRTVGTVEASWPSMALTEEAAWVVDHPDEGEASDRNPVSVIRVDLDTGDTKQVATIGAALAMPVHGELVATAQPGGDGQPRSYSLFDVAEQRWVLEDRPVDRPDSTLATASEDWLVFYAATGPISVHDVQANETRTLDELPPGAEIAGIDGDRLYWYQGAPLNVTDLSTGETTAMGPFRPSDILDVEDGTAVTTICLALAVLDAGEDNPVPGPPVWAVLAVVALAGMARARR